VTAIVVTLEMVETVAMWMSVKQTNTIAETDIDALIKLVVSSVKILMNAYLISINVMQTLYAKTVSVLMTVTVDLVIKEMDAPVLI